ncbi:phage tail tube protein [Streptomyces lunaelactis]|uniref:phage tail tube protein n=1 Tax=Streptomyces lunaelactis TaxID=1535768 RepID=UPI0015848543|nr:hypothetical protein [Streptomyces lunaelactis]NUK22072.1 hypothetical protein [Streptomyces lunaelactis]
MAAEQFNVRDYRFEIEIFASPGTWQPIGPKGIETCEPGFDYETADTTTFGSNGQAEGQNMQISKTMQLEGKRLRDKVTGAIDTGQAMVEAQAERLGDDSLIGWRFAHKDDTTWIVWPQAYFQLGAQGGGTNEKGKWGVTVNRSGPSTTAVKV